MHPPIHEIFRFFFRSVAIREVKSTKYTHANNKSKRPMSTVPGNGILMLFKNSKPFNTFSLNKAVLAGIWYKLNISIKQFKNKISKAIIIRMRSINISRIFWNKPLPSSVSGGSSGVLSSFNLSASLSGKLDKSFWITAKGAVNASASVSIDDWMAAKGFVNAAGSAPIAASIELSAAGKEKPLTKPKELANISGREDCNTPGIKSAMTLGREPTREEIPVRKSEEINPCTNLSGKTQSTY